MMKLTTYTTAALLGTALALQAQVETERSTGATRGGLHTTPPTRLHDGDVPGEATERQKERAEAGAERARLEREARQVQTAQPGQQGEQPGQPATQPGQPATQPGQQGTQPGQPATQPQAQPGQPATQPELQTDEPDWRGTDHEDMELGELPAGVQQGLRQAAAGGQLGGEVTRMRFGEQELFHGRADLEGAEKLHIYVDSEGELVKTQQELDLEHAPEPVRQAARQHDQQQSLDQIVREVSNGEISYIMELEVAEGQTRWIQLDERGRVLKTHEQHEDESPEQQEGQAPGQPQGQTLEQQHDNH